MVRDARNQRRNRVGGSVIEAEGQRDGELQRYLNIDSLCLCGPSVSPSVSFHLEDLFVGSDRLFNLHRLNLTQRTLPRSN